MPEYHHDNLDTYSLAASDEGTKHTHHVCWRILTCHTLILMFVVLLFHRIFAASRGIKQSFDGPRKGASFCVVLNKWHLRASIYICPASKELLRLPAMEVEIHIL